MTDEELLAVAEKVLADAIQDAEFSGLAKDVQYVQMVAEKVEGLRAKIQKRQPVALKMYLIGSRMMIEYEMPKLPYVFGRNGER